MIKYQLLKKQEAIHRQGGLNKYVLHIKICHRLMKKIKKANGDHAQMECTIFYPSVEHSKIGSTAIEYGYDIMEIQLESPYELFCYGLNIMDDGKELSILLAQQAQFREMSDSEWEKFKRENVINYEMN
jgi:hypothetical protein